MSKTLVLFVITTIKQHLITPLTIFLLLGSNLSSYAAVERIDRIVAVVDDDIIMETELLDRAAAVRRKMRQGNTQVPSNRVLLEQTLEQMIVENIELQLAKRLGIRINDNEVNEAIKNIARRNNLSADKFREALAGEGLSYNDFRERIRHEMIITQLRQRRVANRINISQADVDNFLKSEVGKTNLAPDYRLSHILIEIPPNANTEERGTAEQKAFDLYKKLKDGADFAAAAQAESAGQNAPKGGDLGWRKAAQLPTLFSETVLNMQKGDVAEPIRSPSGFHIIKVSDLRGGSEHLVKQTQVRHILIKPNEIRTLDRAELLIKNIRQRIASGRDSFTDMAKTYSDDPGSAQEGGELGWVNPGSMVGEFEQQMQSANIGKLSQPFQSQYGWHILEVTDRRQQDMSETVRINRAREMIRRRKYDQELDTWLREIRQNAYVDLRLDPGKS